MTTVPDHGVGCAAAPRDPLAHPPRTFRAACALRTFKAACTMRALGYAVSVAFAAFGILLFLGLVSLRLPVGGPAQKVAGICLALYGTLRFFQTWLRGRPVACVDDGNEE